MLLAPEDSSDTNASSIKTAKRKVVLQKTSSKTDITTPNQTITSAVSEPAFPNDPTAALHDVINSLYAVRLVYIHIILA